MQKVQSPQKRILDFWFGGNYGYNSRQQFGECTPSANIVPHGVFLYPKKYRESLGDQLDKLEFT